MDTILCTEALTKRFGAKLAVNNVSMTLHRGEIYGFIGKNGAGKTTFMRLVLGMAQPTSGSVELFGGESQKAAGKKTGSLIEAPAVYKGYTAFENMKLFGLLSDSSDTEINEILSFVGLEGVGNKKVGKFSLGMKQRLGLAIALLGKPEFLVLDEPVNGLDPAGIKEIRDIILRLNREKQTTFLISSHLLGELSKVVTKYGIIDNGSLVEELSADELMKKCPHRLKFTLDDAERAVGILSGIMPREDIEAYANTVILRSHLDEAGQLNRLLCQNGLLVSGIEQQSGGLEQYFIERTGS